ncbi:FMRFamide-related neuropeptides-like [Vespula maculifrons]|uniref:FMRFamide-related neuropeptides-like n=1 Tax=Vespula maculifrons TaxID=7453 RepID=A0ABD2BQ76_VESMC
MIQQCTCVESSWVLLLCHPVKISKSSRGDRFSKSPKGEKISKSSRGDRFSKSPKGEKISKSSRGDRFSKSPKGEKISKSSRGDRFSQSPKGEKISKSSRGDRFSKSPKGAKVSKSSRGDRLQRPSESTERTLKQKKQYRNTKIKWKIRMIQHCTCVKSSLVRAPMASYGNFYVPHGERLSAASESAQWKSKTKRIV